jgi:hypothetical protein
VKERTGYPHALSVQNTKNATERSYAVQTTLARAGLNAGVVLALQSVDPHTLASIKRDNISTESFEELQRRYTRDHVPTYTDLILALPGETYESYVNGVNHIIDHGQHRRLSFYNCSILPNAEMGDPAYQRQHAIRFVPQRMLSAHQAITTVSDEEVPEYIDTVIETSAMPRADWLKAKTFWWMTEFLYYDRVCQLPFAILRHHYGVSYRDLIEAALHADPTAFPVCGRIQQLFREKAQAIQAGDIEWIPSPEWLGILWPADQYALLSVVTRGEFDAFYGEIHAITAGLLRDRGIEPEPGLLDALFAFGRCLFRLPFQEKDLSAELPYNFWECYESILESHPIPLRRHTSLYTIHRQGASFATRDVWFEHIVFCTNQKTPYMYEVTAAERESARLMREMLSAAR